MSAEERGFRELRREGWPMYRPREEEHFKAPAVLATYRSVRAAQQTALELNRLGFETSVEDLGAPPGGYGDVTDQPFPFSLTHEASQLDRAMKAARPAYSGLAGQPEGETEPYLLTVMISDHRYDVALEVIRRHGGNLG